MVKILKPGSNKKALPKRNKEPEIELTLPNERSEPSESLQDFSLLIYGRKKIGKTSLTSQFEKTLGLMCEPGAKAQSMYQVPCRSWKELRGYTKLFIQDKRFQTASVDTADIAYELCMEHVCQELVIDHPSDEAYGKGWKAVRAEFNAWVTELLHSGKGVIFISHSKDEEFKTRRSETYHKTGASMAGQAKDILEGLVDIWGCYEYDGKERVLIIGGNDEVDAGHRVEGRFRYTDGTPVERIPMGKSAKEAYRNFTDAFNNRLQRGSTGKTKLTIGVKRKQK
jgi:hypothetical protein